MPRKGAESKKSLLNDYIKLEKMIQELADMREHLRSAGKNVAEVPPLDITADLIDQTEEISKYLENAAAELEHARKMLEEI